MEYGLEDSVQPVLQVDDLTVAFAAGEGGIIHAVNDVSFALWPGEILGLVGESGCGKSVTLRSLIGLQTPGAILSGVATMGGVDLLSLSERQLATIRGSEIAMIFQDPGSSLNPVLPVGGQLAEVLRVKRGLGRREARDEAVQLLTRVGIGDAARRARDYAHQLSGGMRQRVMIAMALGCNPRLMLADEPTTALDVTIQDQILALLAELKAEYKMALLIVSHDLGVIGQICDRIAVMYAGRIVEYGATNEVLDTARHPYTEALLASAPVTTPDGVRRPLRTIPGQPPDLADLPKGCSFAPRCAYAGMSCRSASMELDRRMPLHGSACLFPDRVGR